MLVVLAAALVVTSSARAAQAANSDAARKVVHAPKAPYAVAVLPFEDLRHPGHTGWLGRFLAERIARALVRSGQVAVLDLDTAGQWQRKLDLHADSPVTAALLDELGVQVLVQGTTQEVLGLVEIDLRVRSAQGDLLAGKASHLRVLLSEQSPGPTLERVLGALQAAMLPRAGLNEPHPPADWTGVERLYTLLGEPVVPGDPGARPGLIARLRPLASDAALGPRAREALAELLLEQAQLYLPKGAGRDLMLQDALQHVTAALEADPRDTHRQAMRAELLYFLKHYYEAKTDASVARLRNPLESLSYVVLGLVAGLSTGEATVHLKRALAIDPFLRTQARTEGSVPYQGGILEPSFDRWEELRASGGLAREDEYDEVIRKGRRFFQRKQWDEAERVFRKAAERDDADYRPWLYLNRILIELGHPERAVAGLQRLADGNPQEPKVLYWLAESQLGSGSPAAAQANYRKVLALQPDDLRSQNGLADADMALGQWPNALNDLRAVLQATPTDAHTWLRLGIVRMQQGEWTAAKGALERALELAPDSAEARKRLAEVHEHLDTPPAQPAAPGGPAPQTPPQPGAQK
ncbi:MAG TPA: tetratricopeptide repeat protein [bacterium]|nr:tetratricopeptide repeat protein [bacterium]